MKIENLYEFHVATKVKRDGSHEFAVYHPDLGEVMSFGDLALARRFAQTCDTIRRNRERAARQQREGRAN